ncbi:MAG: M1 family aminopeptidase [Bacteroidota bacterium]
MRLLSPILATAAILISHCAFGLRSDSVRISNTAIHLTITNFVAKKISGHCLQTVHFKVASNRVDLDLSSLTTDSVKADGSTATFQHIGDRLKITLPKVYQIGDSCVVDVHYQGTPAADPGGWGGFYFSGNYAFNLGVGFTVDPHSYGRAWFPCIDEFTIKSVYDFHITTANNYTAACNGLLMDTTHQNSTITWHFHENSPMSAYLASVSVSQYSVIKSTITGINQNFPAWLYCPAADTIKVKQSFVNLPFAINAFEKAFGPQPYQKVGYNMVPFNNGAMEHAGNITYPAIYADGSTNYETLLAHELSHHWWGDAVTCADAGDMWLNEGWASYCEHFFTEQLYGRAAYNTSIAANHLFVLRFAHIRDGAVYSMVNIPHSQTYGSHVYKKGADVVHSLRSVVGDSVFFKTCKAYQQQYRYDNSNTNLLQSSFEQFAGVKATSFFTNWVKDKGQPHVIISKQTHSGTGPFRLQFKTYQKPRFTNQLYTNLPVEVFFFKDRLHYEKRVIVINQQTDSFDFSFDFKPVFVCLDYEQLLSDAITEKNITSTAAEIIDVPEIIGRLMTKKIVDTAFIRLEHHWVGPEQFITQHPAMSNYRYVTLDGIWHDSDAMDLELTYDGRQPGSSAILGYLDHTLIFKTEDSLTVMYRGFPGDYWRPWSDIQLSTGNKNDKFGKLLIKNARKGDYALAMYDRSLSVQNTMFNNAFLNIAPNPATAAIIIHHSATTTDALLSIYDVEGRCIWSQNQTNGQTTATVDTALWATGIYMLQYNNGITTLTQKIVVAH